MDINLLGSIASLVGVGTTLVQWLFQIKNEGKRATIDEYLEWLRRQNHTEVVAAIEGNRDTLGAVEALIREVSDKLDAIPEKLGPLIAATETTVLKEFSATESRITVQLAQLREMLQLVQDAAPLKPQASREEFEIRPGNVQVTTIVRASMPRELQFGVDMTLVNRRSTMTTVVTAEALLELNGKILPARVRLVGSLAVPRDGGAVQVRAETQLVQDVGLLPKLVGVRLKTLQDSEPLTLVRDERLWNELVLGKK